VYRESVARKTRSGEITIKEEEQEAKEIKQRSDLTDRVNHASTFTRSVNIIRKKKERKKKKKKGTNELRSSAQRTANFALIRSRFDSRNISPPPFLLLSLTFHYDAILPASQFLQRARKENR